MWCGGIIFFDHKKRKQEIIAFVHQDQIEVLVSILKQAWLEIPLPARSFLDELRRDLIYWDDYADERFISMSKEEGEELEALAYIALANSDDPEALLTEWCARHAYFREYGQSEDDALKGWSFFTKCLGT